MKTCKNCGAQMRDEDKFCPYCGADNSENEIPRQPQQPRYNPYQQQNQSNPYQQKQNQYNPYQQPQNSSGSYPNGAAYRPTPQYAPAGNAALGMGWHNFICKVSWILSIVVLAFGLVIWVINLVRGFSYFVSYYPVQLGIEFLIHALSVAATVIFIISAANLRQMKEKGIKLLFVMLFVNLAANIINILYEIIAWQNFIYAVIDISIIAGIIVLIIVNNVYYKKRKHLFS